MKPRTALVGIALCALVIGACEPARAQTSNKVRTLADCDAAQRAHGAAGTLVATIRTSCTVSKHTSENCKEPLNPKGYPTARTYCVWIPPHAPQKLKVE